jgi:hypothetical protein
MSTESCIASVRFKMKKYSMEPKRPRLRRLSREYFQITTTSQKQYVLIQKLMKTIKKRFLGCQKTWCRHNLSMSSKT